jgi:TP901-1 family phage major tail protein
MAAQKGRELVLKLGDGGSPETFTTFGGLRDTEVSINEQEVDITSKDDSGVRQLLDGNILRSVSISGSGVFKDGTDFNTVRDAALAGTHLNYQIVIPGTSNAGGTYEGAFRITNLSESGAHDGEAQYNLSLESASAVTWTDAT